jgi:hypothetical protein
LSSRLPLFIDKAVQQALIDSAHKNRISTLYAAQMHLIKSLRSDNFLKDSDYQRLLQQFTQPLTKEEPPKPQSPEEIKQQQIIDEKNRLFQMVLSQWDLTHKPGWKEDWLRQAEKWQDKVPTAKALLERYAKQVIIS